MNSEKLKDFIEKSKIETGELAAAANMNISTWYRKMQKKGDSFTVKEMNAIIQKMNIGKATAADIFF